MNTTSRWGLAAASLAAAWPAVAGAVEVRGSAATVLSARQERRADGVTPSVPAYELVDVQVDDVPMPLVDRARLVASFWGRAQLAGDPLHTHDADVGLLYLDTEWGAFGLRAGRQQLIGGVGRMRLLDGIDVRYVLPFGMSAEVFFGATVRRRFAYDTGTWQVGARVAQRLGKVGEVGVAWVQARRLGVLDRQELAADGYASAGPFRLSGYAVLEPTGLDLTEARFAATWVASEAWSVTVDYERTVPDLMLSRTSIFSVLSDIGHDGLGGDVAWVPNRFFDVLLAARATWLDGSQLGYRLTLRAATYRDPSHASRIGAELERLDEPTFAGEPERGYLRARVFTTLQVLEVLRLTADLYGTWLDQAQNGVPGSLLGQVGARWDLRPELGLAASVGAGTTPRAVVALEGTMRLVYGFDFGFARAEAL